MTLWQAIVLGVVQGIAEFLPVSSSGHLVVLQTVFGIEQPGITFDIVLHLGSLSAVFAVFWKDIKNLVTNPFQKLTGLLIVGTIPAVIVGFMFKSEIERIFVQGFYLALAFIFTGILLWVADSIGQGSKRTVKSISYFDALTIGLMQAVGIPPGISRSGATITGGLICGLSRETAARFSFLLSIIVIAGAGTLEAWELYTEQVRFYTSDLLPFMLGFFAAALSGYLAIRLLLQLIKSCKLRYFSYYLFVLGAWILVDRFVFNLFFVH